MKIVEKVLKNKLASMGFSIENFSELLNQIDFDLIESKVTNENDVENLITVRKYTEPTVEISRMLINYNKF